MNAGQIKQAFIANAKLGWNQEGNWAPPLVYLLFSLIAPISGVLMLVFMYRVVKGDAAQPEFLAFLLAGSAMFLFVRAIMTGAGLAVIEDREHYRLLRYLYISPMPFPVLISGRVVVKLVISLAGLAATLGAGYLFLGVPFRAGGVDWLTVMSAFLMGLVGLVSFGWILASMMLLVDRMGWVWAEGISGLMFLASGAVIPFSFLPPAVAWVGRWLPMTYWGDLWRRALYGDLPVLAQPDLSAVTMWLRFLALTAVWTLAAAVWYRLADQLARKLGRIERETFY